MNVGEMIVNPGAIDALNEQIVTKVNGNNGSGNNNLEARNANNTGIIILNATAPTANTPSIWMEVNVSTNKMYFYKDTGSGWSVIGHIDITP